MNWVMLTFITSDNCTRSSQSPRLTTRKLPPSFTSSARSQTNLRKTTKPTTSMKTGPMRKNGALERAPAAMAVTEAAAMMPTHRIGNAFLKKNVEVEMTFIPSRRAATR